MNPEEELPPDVAPRAYYHQPVWKRIVVIARGAGDEHADRVPDPVRARVRRRRRCSTKVVRRSPRTLPPQGKLQAGRPDRRRRRQARPPGDVEEQLKAFRKRISSHKCAGRQRPGLPRGDPGVLHGRAGRPHRDGADQAANTTPRRKRTLVGFAFGEPRSIRASVEAAKLAVDQMWYVTKGTVTALVADLRARAAQADLGRRGQLRGDTRRASRIDPRRALTAAGGDQPLARRSSTCSRSCRSTAATSSGAWSRRCAAGRFRSA